ncbi:MAG: ATP-binding protein, partial [Cyanobacteria bacterium J06631_9]
KNTQLEAALQELQQAQIHLVHSEKISSLGQLVSGVAHEINNPLGFVSGSIGHLKGYTADLVELLELYQSLYGEDHPDIGDKLADVDINFVKEDIFKLLSSMKIGTQRMIEIVRSLRNFSRLDHNGFQLANIHDGIDSTLMLLSYRMAQVGPQQSAVAVVKEYGNLPEINCDIGQLNQVFMNLFANAVDAFDEMSNDTEVIKPSLTIGTQQQGDWIVINISDNGPGMPPEMLKDIFQPFFTTKPTNRGTGLGLSISHQVITEKHRGEISCYSQLGKGTTFTIRLPM